MKQLIIKYKSVIKFIFTFLLVYSVLSISYKLYLDFSKDSLYFPDYFTHLVAKQSESLLQVFDYNVSTSQHPDEASIKLIVENKFVAKIVEGCNSISVIILFTAFIIAFAGRVKTTFLYVIAGSILIYIVNLIRIVLIAIALFHYPNYEDILHTVLFPLIIYGMVFLLWMFWINKFSKLKTKNA